MDLSIPLPEKSKIVFYDGGKFIIPALLDSAFENHPKNLFILTRVLIGKDLSDSYPNGAREFHDLRICDGMADIGYIGYKGQIIREVTYSSPMNIMGVEIEGFEGFNETGDLIVK